MFYCCRNLTDVCLQASLFRATERPIHAEDGTEAYGERNPALQERQTYARFVTHTGLALSTALLTRHP